MIQNTPCHISAFQKYTPLRGRSQQILMYQQKFLNHKVTGYYYYYYYYYYYTLFKHE